MVGEKTKVPVGRGLWRDKPPKIPGGARFMVGEKTEVFGRVRLWVGEKFRKGWIFVAVCGMMVAESKKEVP